MPELKLPDTPEFRRMWDEGLPLRAIGGHFGVHARTVGNKARLYGYPKRDSENARRPVVAKPADPSKRAAQVLDKTSIMNGNIKASVSVPAEPWLQVNTPEAESVSEDHLRAAWRADVMELFAEGLGVEDIAIRLNCSAVDVRYEQMRLRKAGVIAAAYGVANG